METDSGFAPNPFHGWCTLACCKPNIRAQARPGQPGQPGDLIVGLSSLCERIVYVMEVAEKMSFAEYWADARFLCKRPDLDAPDRRKRCGDNIYSPNQNGTYTQTPSAHWDHVNGCESTSDREKDTGVDAVLVGREFVYFGKEGPALPEHLQFLTIRRAHRSRFTREQVEAAERFFHSLPRGELSRPGDWPPDDDVSWIPGCD